MPLVQVDFKESEGDPGAAAKLVRHHELGESVLADALGKIQTAIGALSESTDPVDLDTRLVCPCFCPLPLLVPGRSVPWCAGVFCVGVFVSPTSVLICACCPGSPAVSDRLLGVARRSSRGAWRSYCGSQRGGGHLC